MLPLIAQAGMAGTLVHWSIVIIIAIAVLCILFAFVRWSGIQIPAIAIYVFWTVVIAVLCIVGIKIIASIW